MVTTSENGFVEEPDDSRLRKTGGLARFQFEGKFADGCENPPAMSNDSTIGRSVYACAGSPPRVARVNLWMGAMASVSPFNHFSLWTMSRQDSRDVLVCIHLSYRNLPSRAENTLLCVGLRRRLT